MSKLPQEPRKPPLKDVSAVQTLFATECALVGVGGGAVTLVFAEQRPSTDVPPRMERIVVARIALPPQAASKMIFDIERLADATQQMAAGKPPGAPTQ